MAAASILGLPTCGKVLCEHASTMDGQKTLGTPPDGKGGGVRCQARKNHA